MKRIDRSILLLAAACATFAAVACNRIAQPASAPAAAPQFRNLQVLSKDITRDQLMTNMKFFAQSLGVRCTHCHVGEEGKPLSTFDFASDAKKEKKIARAMHKMVDRINDQELGVTEFMDEKVTCYTCHRGATKPMTAPPPPAG